MRLRIDRHDGSDGVVVLTVGSSDEEAGPVEVDLLSADQFQAALDGWTASGKPGLIIDLSRVGYLYSRPFWAIARAAEEAARRGGALVLVGLADPLKRILELTSAADITLVRTTVDEARRAFLERPVAAPSA